MRGTGKSVAEIIKGRSALLVIKGFKTSAAGLNKIFAYLIGCGSSVVCNYIDNNLYTILMSLITHCLKFITSTELIIADFEISRLIVIVPLSVAVKIHTAVFALNYAPAESVRAGLASVLRAGALVPVLATRDFMITPQFLKQRYKIPPEHIEFPIVEERAALSEPETVRSGTQGALMARSSFASFAGSVVAARGLRSTAILCICIALVGSILGAGLMFVLTFLGADLAASCWNLFLYTALWLLPGLLAGLLAGRA